MALPVKFLRNAAALACGVALAGCVSGTADDLLASTAIVAELPRESGAMVEAARFSAGRAGEAPPGGWSAFVVSPFATKSEYRLVESNPLTVLEGVRQLAAAGFITGASGRNWAGYGGSITLPGGFAEVDQALLSDPQTSGGLLLSVAPRHLRAVLALLKRDGAPSATVIGQITRPQKRLICMTV